MNWPRFCMVQKIQCHWCAQTSPSCVLANETYTKSKSEVMPKNPWKAQCFHTNTQRSASFGTSMCGFSQPPEMGGPEVASPAVTRNGFIRSSTSDIIRKCVLRSINSAARDPLASCTAENARTAVGGNDCRW